MTLQIAHEKHEGYEDFVSFSDDSLEGYIAIHNTKLGPALGGCRVKSYASSDDAKLDALRLAKGMSYKSSLAGLNLGGGKCVINAPTVTRDMMLKLGEVINTLNGRYITAEDVGTTLPDIEVVAEVSKFTAHLDGSSNTALGVLAAMQAALSWDGSWGTTNPSEVSVWVQGLGKVGYDLAQRIHALADASGPNMFVSDLRNDLVQKACVDLQAREITESDKKFITIYAPCAMGQVVNAANVSSLTYAIICGSANNQLVDDDYAELLLRNNVTYCPDYLVNAGGVITAAGEIEGWTADEVEDRCRAIGSKLLEVFALSASDKTNPLMAANRMAESRFA